MKTINLLGVEGAGSTLMSYSLVCLLLAHFGEHKKLFLSFLYFVDTGNWGFSMLVGVPFYLRDFISSLSERWPVSFFNS